MSPLNLLQTQKFLKGQITLHVPLSVKGTFYYITL